MVIAWWLIGAWWGSGPYTRVRLDEKVFVEAAILVDISCVIEVLSFLGPGSSVDAVSSSVQVELLLIGRGLLVPVLLESPVGILVKADTSGAGSADIVEFLKTAHVANGVHGFDVGPLVEV